MKAILLRVGIDKGTDGVLAPIFNMEALNIFLYNREQNKKFKTNIGL
jgi:hypothetical protein